MECACTFPWNHDSVHPWGVGYTRIAYAQKLMGLFLTEAVDPEDANEGDWGVPVEGTGGISTLMISWIEASRASTRADI